MKLYSTTQILNGKIFTNKIKQNTTMRIENKEIVIEKLIPTKQTVNETVYIANDGKEFKNESSCKRYEESLEGKNYLQEIKQDDLDSILPYLLYKDSYKVSNVIIFKHKIIHDKEVIKKIISYLEIKKCYGLYTNNFLEFNQDDEVLIISWTEGEDTEYTKIFLFEDVLKRIEEYVVNLKSRFL